MAAMISSTGRSRTGRVTMPAWQKRQPRVQPRMISIGARLCTVSILGTMNLVKGLGSVTTMRLSTRPGHAGFVCGHRTNRAIVMVLHIIEARDVHALDASDGAQLLMARLTGRAASARAISTMISSPSPITKASMKSAMGSGLKQACPPAMTSGKRSSRSRLRIGRPARSSRLTALV